MKALQIILCICLITNSYSCDVKKDNQHIENESQSYSTKEVRNSAAGTPKIPDIINRINEQLNVSFKNENVIKQFEADKALVTYLFYQDEMIAWYCEMGYDFEGWPIEGKAYYFFEDNLIGYIEISQDGLFEERISEYLLGRKLINYNGSNLAEEAIVLFPNAPAKELFEKTQKIIEYN